MEKNVSVFLSNKIKKVSFCLSILVIMIHSYNVLNIENTSSPIVLLEKFISQGISRVAVPLFFVISGYLFFKNYKNIKSEYGKKLKKKIKTLFIPYIFWNLIAYIIFLLPLLIPQLQQYINGFNKNLTITDFIQAIFLYKYNGTFWFIFNLIILNIISPVIYILIFNRKVGLVFLLLNLILWFLFPSIKIISSILFFTIGAYISVHYFNLLNKERLINNNYYYIIILSLWISLIIIYIITNINIFWQLSICFGIISIWEIFSILKDVKSFSKYYSYTFILYATHSFVLEPIQKLVGLIIKNNQLFLLIDYIVAPILTICLIICIFSIIKKITPKIYYFVSGDR